MTEQESAFEVGEQAIPKRGSFKGKPGTILEKAWSERNKEWVYLLKWVRAAHWLFEDELQAKEKQA